MWVWGRKEGQLRTETIYHPRSPVTNQGRRGDNVQLGGVRFLFRRTSPAPGTQQSPGSGEQDGCPEETLLLCGSALKKRVNTGGHLGEAEAGVCLQPERGQRPGSLGQVFHRQLLLQVPVVGNCHILGGGGQQRDGPAVILSLSWFLLHVHGVAAAGGRAGLSPPPHGDGPAGTQLSAPSLQVTSDCPSVGAMSHRGHRAVPSPLLQPHTPQERGCPPSPRPTNLYCCGDRRGLLLPLLLTCSTVLLTSSWPTCSIPLAELVLIMVGLLSSGKLLSASAACNEQRGTMVERLHSAVGLPWGSRGRSAPPQCCHGDTASQLCTASTGSRACPQQGRAGCVPQGMGMSRASSPGNLH